MGEESSGPWSGLRPVAAGAVACRGAAVGAVGASLCTGAAAGVAATEAAVTAPAVVAPDVTAPAVAAKDNVRVGAGANLSMSATGTNGAVNLEAKSTMGKADLE